MPVARSMISLAGLLLSLSTAIYGSEFRRDDVPLANGGTTPQLTLSSSELNVSVLPELGGKIVRLSDRTGREYLSRSPRPYVARIPGMTYGDTELDGIDECFPTVGACVYPQAPWAGTALRGHGDLWGQAWTVIATAQPDEIVLEAHGAHLPYVFRRRMTVVGARVVLDYTITNTSAASLSYLYAFHPLLRAETGCGLEWPASQPLSVAYSHRDSLGAGGIATTWGALTRDGRPLRDRQFVTDSTRYYKYFAHTLLDARATLRHADGSRLKVSWDTNALPQVAVWSWEGEIPGVNHLAPEPTTAAADTLAEALASKQERTLAAHGVATWQITLEVQPSGK